MKKIFSLLLIVATLFVALPIAHASGSAILEFEGDSIVYAEDYVIITLVLNDITDVEGGIAGIQAKLDYDKDILEFISCEPKALSTDYSTTNNAIVGLALSASQRIYGEKAELITLTFKTLKPAITTISLKDVLVADGKAKPVEVISKDKTLMIIAN